MKPLLACLALALCPAAAAAAERAVVLNGSTEVARGYCEGAISASTHATTTLVIDACHDGGVPGVAPGQTHSFPKDEVHAAKPGLAMAAARTRFFTSPRIVAIMRGGYMPAGGEDFTALATLADRGGLAGWRAFIGLLQPIAALEKAVYGKRLSAYGTADFTQAMDAYQRYADAEAAAIHVYAVATAHWPVAGHRALPNFGAVMLVQMAARTYALPFDTAVPDAWLKLQLKAARTNSAMLRTFRLAMSPLGLEPRFANEMQRMQRSKAEIRQAAMHTYAKAARLTALGVLSDAEYSKPDAAILVDVRQALVPYAHARRAALAAARTEIARTRKLIAATERTIAAMKGRHWQLVLTETDGDPPRHYVMGFVRTGAHALEARIYERDLQYGNLILVLTWPVYMHANGDLMVNSAVNGPVDNAFVIPAAAFAHGRFNVRSLGSSEVFYARGALHRDAPKH